MGTQIQFFLLEIFPERTWNGDQVQHSLLSTNRRQSERTIQIVNKLLQSCMMDFSGSREKHMLLVEFEYSNSYHASIVDRAGRRRAG